MGKVARKRRFSSLGLQECSEHSCMSATKRGIFFWSREVQSGCSWRSLSLIAARMPRFLILIYTVLIPMALAAADPPVIVLDPGHGGKGEAGSLKERSNSSPNNAATPGGLKEKDLTLEFSLVLKEEILAESNRRGDRVGVLLTRDGDFNLDFIQRAATCNRPDTVCVVSIHFNAANGDAMGSLALIAAENRNPGYAIDRAFGEGLAAACSAGVKQFLPQSKDRGVITDGHLHGGLGSNFFFQLNRQPHLKGVPKCFLEVEFIDNPAVEKAILKNDRIVNFRVIVRPIAIYLLDSVQKRK